MPVALLAAAVARGAQVLGVQASRDGNHFQIGMQIVLAAPAAAAFVALRDYPAMRGYDPELQAIRVETTANPDHVRLFLTIHTCMLFFCKTIRQEQLMTATADADGGVLQADFVPAAGAFRGEGTWHLRACPRDPARTCMALRLELEPLFWVPPVIGPWLVRKKMAEEALQISSGLEQRVLEAR